MNDLIIKYCIWIKSTVLSGAGIIIYKNMYICSAIMTGNVLILIKTGKEVDTTDTRSYTGANADADH